MKKVYNESEVIPKLLETYIVRFNMKKSDGFWSQFEESYFTTGKGSHKQVETKWKSDHKKDEVKLISVSYV